MSEEIIKVLDDLGQRFGVVIDWTAENVLPYIEDLLKRIVYYEIATVSIELIITIIAGTLALIFAIKFGIKIYKTYKAYSLKYEEYAEEIKDYNHNICDMNFTKNLPLDEKLGILKYPKAPEEPTVDSATMWLYIAILIFCFIVLTHCVLVIFPTVELLLQHIFIPELTLYNKIQELLPK